MTLEYIFLIIIIISQTTTNNSYPGQSVETYGPDIMIELV